MATMTTHQHNNTDDVARTDSPQRFRQRLFARLWRLLDSTVDDQIRPAKEDVLAELPDRILELGPGRGSNFSYYGPGTEVVAFEPNTLFHDDLRTRAAATGVEVELHGGDLRSAGLASESEDVVVSTLVLCSVADVDAELAEIRRVLRPGGRLVFIEHVAAPPGTWTARAQRLFRRPWRFVADGCDLCAATVDAIEGAGFAHVEAKLERIGPSIDPSTLIYWGYARR